VSCRRRCREARLSSSLSSGLSSAHVAKQRHPCFLLISGDPALTIGCVEGGEAITRDVEDALYSTDRGSQTLRNEVALDQAASGAAGIVVVGFSVSLLRCGASAA